MTPEELRVRTAREQIEDPLAQRHVARLTPAERRELLIQGNPEALIADQVYRTQMTRYAPPMLIGLAGLRSSGKDTLAAYLIRMYGFTRFSFADPVKESAAAAIGMPLELLEQYKNDATACVSWGARYEGLGFIPERVITVREYLQRYGTEAHRDVFGESFWIDQTLHKATSLVNGEKRPAVITDARFENEQRAIKDEGGIILRIDRPSVERGDTHASEQVEHGLTDVILHNSGTIADLELAADQLISDMLEHGIL